MKKLNNTLKYFFLIFCIISSFLIFFFNNEDVSLTIIHTNDLHSHFFSVNQYMQDCQEGPDCLGGFAKLDTFISKERQQNPNILLLDAGDRFSGTYFYTLHKEKDLIPVFQNLKYDVFGLGNHEFDDDLNTLNSFLQNVSTPVVCANIAFPDNSPVKDLIHSSIIVQKNGLKVGVIGALTEDIAQSAIYGDTVQLKPLSESIQKEIAFQKQQGVQFHILLSHLGLEKDKEIAKNIPELDLIVGGHSHDLLSNKNESIGPYPIVVEHLDHNKTLIVTAGAFNRFVGKLNLKINKNGQIISATGDTYPLDKNIKDNQAINQYIQQKDEELNTLLGTHLTTLQEPISLTKDYCGEFCPIADFITNTFLKAFPETDIALINSGAIRSGLPAGEIQLKKLLQVLPFDGALVICEMNGQELINYIEYGLKKYQENVRVNAFLHIAGGSYQFDKNTKKVISVKINNQNIQKDKNYTILLPLFLAKGGDGFPKQTNYQILPQNMIQILSDYLKKLNHNRY